MNPAEKVSHISPERRLLDIDLKEVWQYRDLYVMYVKRDITTYYKQTIFGPLWYLFQPILTTIMYMFVFGTLANIPTDGIPQPLFYLAGISLWNYFSLCFTACSDVFGKNAHIFGKAYFPRLVVPLASFTSNLIRFVIQFALFIAAYLYFYITGQIPSTITVNILLIPFIVALVGILSMSCGMIISSWTVKYKDLIFLIQFGVQLLMYGTPVIYPLSFAPEKYRWLMNLNPLTPLFESFKYVCLGVGTFNRASMLYSLVVTCIITFIAVIVFNKTEQKFIDTI